MALIPNKRYTMFFNTLKYNERYQEHEILDSANFGFKYGCSRLDGSFLYDDVTPVQGNWNIRGFILENYRIICIYRPELPVTDIEVNELPSLTKVYALLYNNKVSANAGIVGALVDASALDMKYASFYTDLDTTTNAKGQFDANQVVSGKWEVRGYLPANENVISLYLKVSD